VLIDSSNIAWQSDLDHKFHNSNDGTTVCKLSRPPHPLARWLIVFHLFVRQGSNFPAFAFWRNLPCTGDPQPNAHIKVNQTQRCLEANANTPGVGWCFPGSGYCTEDPHFVVWMRSAGLPAFRKLFGTIDQELEPGTYTIRVSSGVNSAGDQSTAEYYNWGYPLDNPIPQVQRFLYPVGSFNGQKTVVLSTGTWIGGKNFFLGYAYLIVGIVCIVLAICFFIKSRFSPRGLGNAPYVSWNKDATPK